MARPEQSPPDERRWSPRATVRLACLSALLISAWPLTLVLGANAGSVPLDGGIIARDLALSVAVTALALWALRWTGWALAPRASWLGVALALFGFYGPVVEAIHTAGARVVVTQWGVAATFATGAIALATFVIRPWNEKYRDPVPLFIVATIFLAVNTYRVIAAVSASPGWQPAADALIESVLQSGDLNAGKPTRNIYYLVLDGFGRADTLHRYYDLDLGPFVEHLRSKGFYVPERSQSNYSQTFLALASTLTLNSVDDVAAAIGEESDDRRPMRYLIAQGALARLAKNAGYRVVGVGSDYMATRRLDFADDCICEQRGMTGIEQATVALTPLAGFPFNRWSHYAHYQNVLASFKAIENYRSTKEPTFLFAHILSPHPPFVFAPDGSSRTGPPSPYIFDDGSHYPGSKQNYVHGYHDQVQFVTQRLTTLIDSLLAASDPPPVIVIHGDHGPGSMLNWDSAEETNTRERMTIFAAYFFPDGPPLYPTISPINGARALATGYLRARLPFLPDKSQFSTWNRPYRFVLVPPMPPAD